MGYAATTGVIIYWNPYQPFYISKSHHAWYDEYNYRISIEDKNTLGSLLLLKYPENFLHNSYLLNFIPCELGLKSTPFSDTTILTYEIYSRPFGKKIGFNLFDNEDFTIPYVIDTTPNFPAGHQLMTQDKICFWIVDINEEELINPQGFLNELHQHHNQHGKFKVKTIIFRRKSYQRTYIE